MKVQTTIKLVGYTENGKPARISSEVINYKGESVKPTFSVVVVQDPQNESVQLVTGKGNYTIPFNKMLNLYKGEANGCKIHISLKPISGKLIYWAEAA